MVISTRTEATARLEALLNGKKIGYLIRKECFAKLMTGSVQGYER